MTASLKNSRRRRVLRVRAAIKRANASRPRMTVFRSNKHVYVQVIDDAVGVTVVAASTGDRELSDSVANGGNKAAAKLVGRLIGERCLSKGITEIVFDRGAYKYHGRIAAIAEGAREVGLLF